MVRLRTTPSSPLAQKTQPIAQPTWVLMQIVRRVLVVAQAARTRSARRRPVPAAAFRCRRRPSDARRPGWSRSELLGQLVAKVLGQIGHLLERRGPLLEQPLPHLPRPIARHAVLGEPRLELFGRLIEEVEHGRLSVDGSRLRRTGITNDQVSMTNCASGWTTGHWQLVIGHYSSTSATRRSSRPDFRSASNSTSVG